MDSEKYSMSDDDENVCIFADDPDLIIRLWPTRVYRTSNIETTTPQEYRVNREILESASPVLTALIKNAPTEGGVPVITINESDDLVDQALNTLLHLLHKEEDIGWTYDVAAASDIWEFILLCQQFDIDPKENGGKAWFETWYSMIKERVSISSVTLSFEDQQSLLLPCMIFDSQETLNEVSMYLVMNARGPIVERRHSRFEEVSGELDPQMMEQMNAAKTHLETELRTRLEKPMRHFIDDTPCSNNKTLLYNYTKALKNAEIWPFHEALQNFTLPEICEKFDGVAASLSGGSCGGECCVNNYWKDIGNLLKDIDWRGKTKITF